MQRCCFFHAGCPDGFGAAWAAWRAWGAGGHYVPRGHDDRLDAGRLEGALVVFLDIAPRIEELLELDRAGAQVVVLDHHVTARDRFAVDARADDALASGGHLIHFDLEHSGAMLAWRYFHPEEPAPALLRYVEDQDLWAWKLARSEEVNAAIGSYPLEFEAWDELARWPIERLVAEGEPIVRVNRIEVERALKTARPIALDGRRVEAVNAQRSRSAIGHELAKRAAFGASWGAVYRVTGSHVDVSIYSIGDLDVARIAEDFGGGGHRNAAGFNLGLEEWLRLLV